MTEMLYRRIELSNGHIKYEPVSAGAQRALDWDGAKTAAEAICDYADNNLTMMDAVDMETTGAARIYDAAKTLRDLFAPAVTSTER